MVRCPEVLEAGVELVVTDFVWKQEFDPYHDYGRPPDWLEMMEIAGEYEATKPGALSLPDWTCVIAADRRSGTVVTRDDRLKSVADREGVSTMWSGRFLVDTYVECGLTEREFDAGIDDYLAEAHLPDSTVDTILNTEKED